MFGCRARVLAGHDIALEIDGEIARSVHPAFLSSLSFMVKGSYQNLNLKKESGRSFGNGSPSGQSARLAPAKLFPTRSKSPQSLQLMDTSKWLLGLVVARQLPWLAALFSY
jgi:hypothetical protein